jgi:Ca2+-transporting ATPase
MALGMAQDWHILSPQDVLKRLGTDIGGLTQSEAERRLGHYGANRLPQQPPPTRWQIVLRQFASPLIVILGLAALASGLIGDLKDAGFIVAVVLINALIGSLQEWHAERSSWALQQLLKISAVVERDREVLEIDAEEAVPGDLVWLESGNRVPADVRLLKAHNLQIDESMLTGESQTVQKQQDWQGTVTTPLADRQNMAFAGSMVVRGRGRGIVVATGTATAIGQLAMDMLGTRAGKPPLLDRMERFSRMIALSVIVAGVGIGLLGIFQQGYTLLDMFLYGVALAVSAIPEDCRWP